MQQATPYRTIVLEALLTHIEAPVNDPHRVPNAMFITGPVADEEQYAFTIPGIGVGGAGVQALLTLLKNGSSHGRLRPLNAPPDTTVRNTYSVTSVALDLDGGTVTFAIHPSSTDQSANRRCAARCLRALMFFRTYTTTTGSAVAEA